MDTNKSHNMSEETSKMKSKRDVFRRLAEISKVSNLTPDQRRAYEADVKLARDYHNELEYARSEGLERGLAEGRAEGRAEGQEQGAWQKLCSIVANLRAKGMDTPTIASLIGESPEVVASI